MQKIISVISGGALLLSLFACAPGETDAPENEETRTEQKPAETLPELIARARSIGAKYGDAIWSGWSEAPFGVLLVEEEQETLFCHGGEASGFTPAPVDPATGCDLQTRPREFAPNLLASFPAVDGRETIVVGTPEATGRTPFAWMVTLLHEHFHQMQMHQEGYNEDVMALDLANGDQTGMWMLNYAFPYDNPETGDAFNRMTIAIETALDARGTYDFDAALSDYLSARETFLDTVSEADRRYFEFQLWQEGVARWTEIAVSDAAGADGDSAMADHADAMRKGVRNSFKSVREQGLSIWKRSSFYPVGAGEAMLLESARPDWRARYFAEPLALGPYFESE